MGFKKYALLAAILIAIVALAGFAGFNLLGLYLPNDRGLTSQGLSDQNAASHSSASLQPTAIYHAFHQRYTDIEPYACALAEQGYSHVQISPAQQSNPGGEWWKRYQPYDLSVIAGLGSESDLQRLVTTAHSCQLKVIADVVFNHMADADGDAAFEDLSKYPNLSPEDFHTDPDNVGARPCGINYGDGNRDSELNCWLGGLPDLRFTDNVKAIQKAYLHKLLSLSIDGFRFDAAKHIPPDILRGYVEYVNQQSQGRAWNYLEVISDRDTQAEDYSAIAPVTDFVLYSAMKTAFSHGGDLRRLPAAATAVLSDPRSVTFGNNHDTILSLNSAAINPYADATDTYLATAYVLAKESGTPLIFSADPTNVPFIKTGVRFRQIMKQREQEGSNTKENILRVFDSPTVMLMERGAEGFMLLNKGSDTLDLPALDLTLSSLEGYYRELRNNFTVAIEPRDGKKYVTRWGSWQRGGIQVYGRDALFFVKDRDGQLYQ